MYVRPQGVRRVVSIPFERPKAYRIPQMPRHRAYNIDLRLAFNMQLDIRERSAVWIHTRGSTPGGCGSGVDRHPPAQYRGNEGKGAAVVGGPVGWPTQLHTALPKRTAWVVYDR